MPNEVKPRFRFLSQEEQVRYEEACKQFSNERAREYLNIPLEGSRLFKVLLLNQIGIRTATLPELDLALESGLDLEGHYEDAPEIVLRSKGDCYHNDYLAKSLTEQLKLRDFKILKIIRGLEFVEAPPKIVRGLELVEDNNSFYGLGFKVTDNTQVIDAPDLDHKNYMRKFLRINPDYSIEFDEKANRTLLTRQEGLSGLCLGEYLGLYSGSVHFGSSNSNGRVVVVSD